MKTILDFIPDHVQRLAPYIPGKTMRAARRESGMEVIKMASNENPLGPSPLAMEAIRRAAGEVNLYPDNDASELRAALASRHSLVRESVFVADGSLGILDVLARTLLGPGRSAVSSERSFISYPIMARGAGAEYMAVPMRQHGYDLNAIAAAIRDDTRVVFLANPNNPTGSMFDADDLDAFLGRVPEHVLVVLDEAYYDFAQHFAVQRGVTYTRSLEQVRAGRVNLVVLRTFSKAHGLAGLRIGYACGHPGLLGYFARVVNAFSASAVAQAAALAALDDEAHLRRTLENNDAGVRFLSDRLSEIGIHAIPTSANFLYFEVDENADAFSGRMQTERVIIRSLAPWGIPNGIRVTIGTQEQNEQFMRAMKRVGRQTVAG